MQFTINLTECQQEEAWIYLIIHMIIYYTPILIGPAKGIKANKKTVMNKLRQILRLHERGEGKLKISDLTGVSHDTFKKYLNIYLRLDLTP